MKYSAPFIDISVMSFSHKVFGSHVLEYLAPFIAINVMPFILVLCGI